MTPMSNDDEPDSSPSEPSRSTSNSRPALLMIHRAHASSPVLFLRSLFSRRIVHVDADYMTTKGKLAYSIRTTKVDGQKVTSLFRHSSSSRNASRGSSESMTSNPPQNDLNLKPVASISWAKRGSDLKESVLSYQHPDTDYALSLTTQSER
ncbi:hypothetical protein SCHPADRAFT_510154 [Schizopora paradoxa]|uniref:Uncharacterized protein n=1 Tax=Schizopora paradoxa TaxID=27342 RepID=A0A0H2RG98_9AGAM|nr:hypothetical protein SCHPADRAFT_510154 [Schizopora paradoxa]